MTRKAAAGADPEAAGSGTDGSRRRGTRRAEAGAAPGAGELAALGAKRLAGLLAEIARDDPGAKRRLGLALVAAEGPDAAAAEIARRVERLGGTGPRLAAAAREAAAGDVAALRRGIQDLSAAGDPRGALLLSRRLAELRPAILWRARGDEGVRREMDGALGELAALEAASGRDPEALADDLFAGMPGAAPGNVDLGLVRGLAPALGEKGLARLGDLLDELDRALDEDGAPGEAGDGDGVPSLDALRTAARLAGERPRDVVRRALREIADLRGDPDAFAALFDPAEKRAVFGSAAIARRFLDADRPEDALRAVQGVHRLIGRGEPGHERAVARWEEARIDALEGAGHGEEAQELRREFFRKSLSARCLRAWLAALPDSERAAAEAHELGRVANGFGAHSGSAAIAFLLDWPARDLAAHLLVDGFDGTPHARRDVLERAVDELWEEFPLAACLAFRGVVEDVVFFDRDAEGAEALLAGCARLAERVGDFGSHEDHAAFARSAGREIDLVRGLPRRGSRSG